MVEVEEGVQLGTPLQRLKDRNGAYGGSDEALDEMQKVLRAKTSRTATISTIGPPPSHSSSSAANPLNLNNSR